MMRQEKAGTRGYFIHPDRDGQICDPLSGDPLPAGVAGEIVVTTLSRGWPMIRFGTGDVSIALEVGGDGGVRQIVPLQGRVGQAVQAREIFFYPSHVETLPRRAIGRASCRERVGRAGWI